jgi:hypothetical protein
LTGIGQPAQHSTQTFKKRRNIVNIIDMENFSILFFFAEPPKNKVKDNNE